MELLRGLRDSRWAPRRVICLSDDVEPHGSTVRGLGYPLTVIPRMRGFDLSRSLLLRRQLVEDGIVIVHAVNWLAAAYALVAAPRRALVISSIRNSRMPATRLRRLLLRQMLKRSAAVLVNSERARELLLRECRVPADRLTLVRNSVDLDRVKGLPSGALRRELGIAADAPLVLYVGRNAPVKNIPRLLAVTRQVLACRPDIHVVIAGEGLDAEMVTDSEGTESRLHCLGVRQDVPALLDSADLLLLTSDSEGMPNVVLEALAASVPVVATSVGDLPTLLPPGCGILAPPDVDLLASATLQVLASPDSYRRALARHADDIAATYSVPAMVAGTTTAWREAVERCA